ncbi:MAG: hypothetical protein M0Z52_07135 [Actinomycetota bacterium]|nr:hypothetical protein [Actinomycetota bacterium]
MIEITPGAVKTDFLRMRYEVAKAIIGNGLPPELAGMLRQGK